MVRCLRIHLAMQGIPVRFLAWEDPTCLGATKPEHHDYLALQHLQAATTADCASREEKPPSEKPTHDSDTTRGEGNGDPLQYSCLENPMDRGAWWAAVHGVVKSQT